MSFPESKPIVNHAIKKKSNYRWFILSLVFILYVVAYADRVNIGIVLPYIQNEFSINNFQTGAISSFFFLGYALTQIPAGFLLSKIGTRGFVSIAVIGFSVITFSLGLATGAIFLVIFRLLLGLAEGPIPVSLTSTINQWFPAKEKATATGVYIASTQLAPVIVPIVSAAIALSLGWRYVFFIFAIPGLVVAALWYFFARSKPEESPMVSQAELDYIRQEEVVTTTVANVEQRSLGWIDKFIRYQKVQPLNSGKKVFTSWNIWGITLAYFLMNGVLYGMLTWIPMYLVNAKHFSLMSTGFLAATPAIGGIVGALLGGLISDRVFLNRRKPTMLITAITTAIMMMLVIQVPNNALIVAIFLGLAGFFLNIGWPAFTAYSMNLTTRDTYPIAIGTVNTGGNLGGFFSPMIVGAVLDATGNYNLAFGVFGIMLLTGFIVLLTIKEPAHA